MKALIVTGTPDHPDVTLADVAAPDPAPDRLLIDTIAAGVTTMEPQWSTSWIDADGEPRDHPVILGREISGLIVEVGAEVKGFAVGERVFGMIDAYRDGGMAERVNVSPEEVIALPLRLDASAAAAMSLSGLTAWQALVVYGRLAKGQTVLIHGGAGGVGSFALQLARWIGAHVVTTADAKDADFCRELGADEVIDFRHERFEEHVRDVDLVFDVIGGEVQERSWGVLAHGGRLVTIAGEPEDAPDQERAAAAGVTAVFFIVAMDAVQLATLRDLALSGDVVPIVGRRIPLDKAAQAFSPENGKAGRGKTVIIISECGGLPNR